MPCQARSAALWRIRQVRDCDAAHREYLSDEWLLALADLVKIRVQADPSGSTTVVGAFRHILSHEGGVRGLWQGLGPTMQRAAVLTATQVPVYDEFKRQALSRGWFRVRCENSVGMAREPGLKYGAAWQEGVGLHFVASVIAGLASALTTSPIDVVKTRIMNQRASAASGALQLSMDASLVDSATDCTATGQLYRGVIHAASQIMRTEGPLAFYKVRSCHRIPVVKGHSFFPLGSHAVIWYCRPQGFFPNWYRIAPHTTVSLIVFEAMRAHVGAAAI